MGTVIAKIALAIVQNLDEEKKGRLVVGIVAAVCMFLMILVLPFYLITNPIEAFGFSQDSDEYKMVAQLQNETTWYMPDSEALIPGDYTGNIDVSGDYIENNIPLLLQGDKRWGHLPYGNHGTLATSACGPTSMAMVVVGLTGNTGVNPKVTADWSVSHGYRASSGTSWGFFPACAKAYGIRCSQVSYSASSIIENLRAGKVMITSMKPGHFTKGGHFIVLRGITESGKILVNDPASKQRSNQSWDVGIVSSECKAAWSFWK